MVHSIFLVQGVHSPPTEGEGEAGVGMRLPGPIVGKNEDEEGVTDALCDADDDGSDVSVGDGIKVTGPMAGMLPETDGEGDWLGCADNVIERVGITDMEEVSDGNGIAEGDCDSKGGGEYAGSEGMMGVADGVRSWHFREPHGVPSVHTLS